VTVSWVINFQTVQSWNFIEKCGHWVIYCFTSKIFVLLIDFSIKMELFENYWLIGWLMFDWLIDWLIDWFIRTLTSLETCPLPSKSYKVYDHSKWSDPDDLTDMPHSLTSYTRDKIVQIQTENAFFLFKDFFIYSM